MNDIQEIADEYKKWHLDYIHDKCDAPQEDEVARWWSSKLLTYGNKREAEGREKVVDYIEDNYIPGGGGNEMLNFVNTLKSARSLNKDE